jgi:hypothetical protein
MSLLRASSRLFSASRVNFASVQYKNAAPETPLAHYRAEKHATSSINHRLFYVNIFFLVWFVDTLNTTLDW